MSEYREIDPNEALRLAINEINNELTERFDGPLSERNVVAITTAIRKAGVAGFRIGAGQLMDAVEARTGSRFNFEVADQIGDPDAWAARYGGGS